MKPLTISIDLDKTWTADPTVSALIAHTFRARGHTVIICTHHNEENLTHEERIHLQIPKFITLFFTSYNFKHNTIPFPINI